VVITGRLGAGEGGVVVGFDAGRGGDPDDGDEGTEAECELWVVEGEGNSGDVGEDGEPVLVLDGGVLGLKLVGFAEAAGDGHAQKKEAEAGDDHGRGVECDREGVHFLFEDVGGEERQEREAEEEEEIGVENEFVGFFGAVDEVVVIDPVDADEGKGDGIDGQGGDYGEDTGEIDLEAGGAFGVRDLELEHHDGDDDGDDAVGEGFEAGWGGDRMGHEFGRLV
jgi:hypothetical protein